MADVTYRIIIEGMGGGGGSGGSGGAPKSTATTTSGEEVSPIVAAYNKVNKVLKMAPVAYALKYVDTIATTEFISRVELRTGRSTYQQQLEWKKQIILKGASIAGMIVGGAITGNPMAVIAGIGTLGMTALNYSIEQENINIARRVENISIGMANIRAGAGGDRTGRSSY